MCLIWTILALGSRSISAASAVYNESFDTGAPGWQGGHVLGYYSHSDDSYYYWDAGGQEALYVKQPNKNIDGDDHFYAHAIDYDGNSFKLTFAIYVLDNQYDAGLRFGLSTSPNDAWGTPDVSGWAIQYGTSDAGSRPHVTGKGVGDSDWHYYDVVNYYTTEGHWWYHEFTYDHVTETAHTLVSQGKTPGGLIIIDNYSAVPGGYSADMDYLVLSDNRNHSYPSTSSNTYGIGYLDDISFVPEPATLALLAIGSVALLRRRRK